jgi:hypothetical protein
MEKGSERMLGTMGPSSLLAQRAAWEGPRWTRAVEDQSAPIPEEIASELGGIIHIDNSVERSMRAVKPGLLFPMKDEVVDRTSWKNFVRRAQLGSSQPPLRLR